MTKPLENLDTYALKNKLRDWYLSLDTIMDVLPDWGVLGIETVNDLVELKDYLEKEYNRVKDEATIA